MALFVEFGKLRGLPPADAAVQAQVEKVVRLYHRKLFTPVPPKSCAVLQTCTRAAAA